MCKREQLSKMKKGKRASQRHWTLSNKIVFKNDFPKTHIELVDEKFTLQNIVTVFDIAGAFETSLLNPN